MVFIFLAYFTLYNGKSHRQRTLVSYSLKGRKESDVTEHKIYGRKQWLAGSDNCSLNEQD